jgi:hypothetical protein
VTRSVCDKTPGAPAVGYMQNALEAQQRGMEGLRRELEELRRLVIRRGQALVGGGRVVGVDRATGGSSWACERALCVGVSASWAPRSKFF